MNPLKELQRHGQSVWLDFITRAFVEQGRLARLVADDGLRGVTSNPTIFQKAISGGAEYDAAVRALLADGHDAHAIYESLAIEDIRKACDVLLPVYEETEGADGFVSLEVNPHFARDTKKTVQEVRDFSRRLARRNVMIKIPATKEGLPAIEQALSEGISINVTLIFSLERYVEVMGAWVSGMTKAAAAGKDLSRISSVASFFVSRVDTLVDSELEAKRKTASPAEQKKIDDLFGKAAIANARLAYALFRQTLKERPFLAVLEKRAHPQRPLWASTSTKNPKYRDVLYIEELVGKDTVNTLPPQTIDAFRDHGKVRDALSEDEAPAARALKDLAALGIDMKKVTQRLEDEGVKAFADSFDQLQASIEKKRQSLVAH